MSKTREQLNDYLKTVNIDGKICLDVGVQDKPTSRLTQGTPKRYFTLDIDKKWSPDIVADLNDGGSFVGQIPDHVFSVMEENFGFDVIFCIETLEHCWNPIQALENLALYSKQGGDLYISVPFVGPHHDVVDYLRFTHEWFRDVLPKVGFEVVEIQERIATIGRSDLIQFYQKEGMRVSKIRPEFGRYTYPIGYFVHAKRNKEAIS